MKSPEEVQAALDLLSGIKKNPATLQLLSPSPDFEPHMPGMVAVLRWILDESKGKSLGQIHAEVSREFNGKPAESRRSRSAAV
jgi:hypothetical protein